ncbi:leukocyte receptor cluster member 1 isoform X1 [Tachyglossus aculeatus]|uniref:leukocyte receptor cluster member 1 isoform X1 n=1 Tax=Tachyglossus aculeatus TaxID=9261 RepID=UPI0018F4B65C|nr:leukocyte receptor cluster member 1 isoform X1 [Tachyglossus aculeatus]
MVWKSDRRRSVCAAPATWTCFGGWRMGGGALTRSKKRESDRRTTVSAALATWTCFGGWRTGGGREQGAGRGKATGEGQCVQLRPCGPVSGAGEWVEGTNKEQEEEKRQEKVSVCSSGHVDLFRGLEDGRGALSANKEHEEEKRQEKERQEKALGLLTYLGQSAAEAQTNPPWYQKPPERGGTAPGPKEDKLKGRLDPLRELERQLRKKKGGGEKRKREPDGKGSAGGPLQGPASLEQLRAERLKREAAERARAEALLAGGGRGPQPREPDEEPDERRRRYNSQFHPELARPPRAHDKAPRR